MDDRSLIPLKNALNLVRHLKETPVCKAELDDVTMLEFHLEKVIHHLERKEG